MIRVALSDWDDTLMLDSEGRVHGPVWQALFPPHGVAGMEGIGIGMKPEKVVRQAIRVFGREAFVTHAIKNLGFPPDWERDFLHIADPEERLVTAAEMYRREFIVDHVASSPNIELNEGAAAMLKRFKQNRIPVGVITSGPFDYVEAAAKRLGLINGVRNDDLVQFFLSGGIVDNPKPHRDPFDLAMDIMRNSPNGYDLRGLQPDEVVMIGDSGSDIRGARNAGIWAIGLETPHTSRQQLLDTGAHLVVSRLDEIDPGPGGTFYREPFTIGEVGERGNAPLFIAKER